MRKIGTVTKNGYRAITKGNARYNPIRKYEHRIVMEQFIGRELKQDEHVHHIDGNKLNNTLDNLQLVTLSAHAKYHALINGLGKDRLGKSPTNKTPKRIIDRIKRLRSRGLKLLEICKITKLSYPTVQKYGTKNN